MKKIINFSLAICLLFLVSVNGIAADANSVNTSDVSAPTTSNINTIDLGPTAPPTNTANVAAAGTGGQSTGDPSLDFLLALQQCTPGIYQQKNILAATVGPQWLQQTIIGMDQDNGTCNAQLSTPDNRTMYCAFTADDLQTMNDQHFLQGMISDTLNNPSNDSISAERIWSSLQNKSCTFQAPQ